MQSSLYVALSAQVALQNRLDTIAQNVANGTSVGYRGSEMKFNAVMSQMTEPQVSFVSSGSGVIKRSSGQFVRTGNPLDVAVKGDGWLSIQTASGQAYTRDGRMRMSTAGDLVSMTGAPILDAGGAPLQLDPTAGKPSIGDDGAIMQGQNRVGVLGLFTLQGNAQLSQSRGQCLYIEYPCNSYCGLCRERCRAGFCRAVEREPHDRAVASDLRAESVRWRQHDAASHRKQPQERHPEPWCLICCGRQANDA